jgi:phage shock protein A
MGIFSRIKGTLTQKANAAIDKATDPAKEVELAIAELEDQRKKALAELISYKANAKQMEHQAERQRSKAAEWESRAMAAIKAGDDELARRALREKKACEAELEKIERDRAEAAGYAAQLNKSRKEFEAKLQMFKLRKGTLSTQLAAARAGGDAFGNDGSVWERFAAAEDKIDRAEAESAIASELDASLRGEDARELDFDRRLAAGAAAPSAADATDATDALAALKRQVERERARKALTAAGGATDEDDGASAARSREP